MKLTKSKIDKLWGENGPYSEVSLQIQTRILDDSVSRVFLCVRANINPLTFELVRENIDQFSNDALILDLINHAEYWGMHDGYVADVLIGEFSSKEAMKEAEIVRDDIEVTIIKMHNFVLEILKLEPKGEA